MVIVSDDRFTFKGITNLKESLGCKQLRIENAQDVRKLFQKESKKWTNQNYLDWIVNICDKMEKDNLEGALKRFANNQYMFNNEEYRRKIMAKLGSKNSAAPTFQGGGLNNEFLLPEINRGVIDDELKR